MALGLALPAVTLAQDSDQQRPPRRDGGAGQGERRPTPPLIEALDANHDGVIDADEIKNASAALAKLDKNGDGKLTMDELRPPRPDGAGGPPSGDNVGPRGNRNGEAGDRQRPQRRNAGPAL